jgi:proteic killer suppression protein
LTDVNYLLYTESVIGGFRHKGLEEIHHTGKTHRIGADHLRKCVRILQLLEVAGQPEGMNIAGFRFRGLQGNPKRWSMRVTGNYRITFGWSGENALDVDFEDYH